MKLKGLNIFITSNEAWGDVWFSKHNYAYELSKKNQVVFVNPVGRWKPARLTGANVSLSRIRDRLFVMNYFNVIPAVHELSFRVNNMIVSKAIHTALERQGLVPDLYLSFDPCRLYDKALLGADKALFIAVDQYRMSILGERMLYPRMDAFVTISKHFNAFYAPFGKPILTIGHAISSEMFNSEEVLPTSGKHGLFIGTMDARLDLQLIEKMAKSLPNVRFVYIGPYQLENCSEANRIFRQGRYPNIHLHGTVPSKQLGAHIAKAGFCIAPMDMSYPGNMFSHHKIFQYLALGKPVFCNEFVEYASIKHLLYMNNDQESTIAQIHHFIKHGEQPDLAAQRIAFARSNTYEAVLNKIEEFLTSLP